MSENLVSVHHTITGSYVSHLVTSFDFFSCHSERPRVIGSMTGDGLSEDSSDMSDSGPSGLELDDDDEEEHIMDRGPPEEDTALGSDDDF